MALRERSTVAQRSLNGRRTPRQAARGVGAHLQVQVGGPCAGGHAGAAPGRGGGAPGVLPSWSRSIVAEICLRPVCSCHEIFRGGNGRTGAAGPRGAGSAGRGGRGRRRRGGGRGGGLRGRRRRRRRRRQLPRGVAAVAEHTEAAHDAASSSIVIGLARSAWRGKLWRRRCCAGCGCLVAAVDVAAVEDSAAARHGDVCARRTDGGAVQ
jgi:hypothetical protein